MVELDREAEFDELEAQCWRAFGYLVVDVMDERIILDPNQPEKP